MKLVDILTTATNAVTPVILLILLGYFLMQKQFLNKEFVKIGNKLVFKVCLPVMLFVNVYNIEHLWPPMCRSGRVSFSSVFSGVISL